MQTAQIAWLEKDKRLHLHHGPIDMIVGIEGPGQADAFERAASRFQTLLEELASELPRLRNAEGKIPKGETAQLMAAAVAPFSPLFVTPMAAVAGAGAETILRAICNGPDVEKAYVNNGGDVAFYLSTGKEMHAAVAAERAGQVTFRYSDPVRGIATSGWRGRSHSLGIADSVTVLAHSAAQADVAATLLANAVDLPGHPNISRVEAQTLSPDSDLGDRLITTHVDQLSSTETAQALDKGAKLAKAWQARGLIIAAYLTLQNASRLVGDLHTLPQKDPIHA